MAADDTPGPRKNPRFLGSGAPATAADLNIVSDHAALVGNRKVGTTAERTAATVAGEVWEGLRWKDTDLDLELEYDGAGWIAPPLPLCTVRRNATASISSGSFQVVSFDTEVTDPYNMWVVGSPSRVTVPFTGIYAVFGNAGITSTSPTGRIATRLLVNGAEYAVGGRLAPLGGATDAGAGIALMLPLSANDYVELSVFQDTGSAKNIGSSSSYATPFLSVALLNG